VRKATQQRFVYFFYLFLKNVCSKNKKTKTKHEKKYIFFTLSHQNVHRSTETLRHDPGCERKDEPNLSKKKKQTVIEHNKILRKQHNSHNTLQT